ncbi:hypothetical protein AFLA_007282 [Aspergillus flavus NRRL3357]|nr:hypothetical protein AFLA_007282 [Aspergillus flavus NRRL3357]
MTPLLMQGPQLGTRLRLGIRKSKILYGTQSKEYQMSFLGACIASDRLKSSALRIVPCQKINDGDLAQISWRRMSVISNRSHET